MTTQQLDRQYVAHTYNRFPLEIAGGKGSTVLGADGREYIDLGSGIAVNIFGLCDEPWQQAVTQQLGKFQHTSNLYYSAPVAQLAQMLCQRTGMSKVFFSNSGLEANECAVKAARKWGCTCKGADYYNIFTWKKCFQGRSIAMLAATGQEHYHEQFQPLPGGFLYADTGDAEGLERLISENPCAAIMIEVVQGEGGVTPIGQEFASQIAALAEKYDLLLIADEVQIGNGRSGKLYGYMQYGLKPDLVTTAKGLGGGLPIGATLFSERVQDVFSPGDHGSTFGGNAACCAGAVNILSRIDAPLLSGVDERSAYILSELTGAKGIKDVRGMGLMLGFEPEQPARAFAETLLKNGVLVTTAKQMIRLLPALNIPMEQLKTAVQIIKRCAAE